jgi:hypothetical protein
VRQTVPLQSQEISVKKATSKKTAAKRGGTLPRATALHSAQQHRKPLAGRISPTSVPAKASPRRETKHDKVLAMLRSKQGTTIAAMMKTTGWQQHSVRGFLTGVVRKRLKLDLISEKPGKDRIYRIKLARPSTANTTTITRSMA